MRRSNERAARADDLVVWDLQHNRLLHEFPIAQYEKAFETMISGEGIKVLLDLA